MGAMGGWWLPEGTGAPRRRWSEAAWLPLADTTPLWRPFVILRHKEHQIAKASARYGQTGRPALRAEVTSHRQKSHRGLPT